MRNGEPSRPALAACRSAPEAAFFSGSRSPTNEKRQVFAYLDENRGGQFEYDIALALSRIGQSHVPKVGLLSPLIAPSDMNDAASKFSFIDALKTAADVAAIPFFAESLPSDLDVLVIVGSAPLKRELLYAIDQHLMRGKGLVVMLDPLTRFNTSGNAVSPSSTSDLNTIADLSHVMALHSTPGSLATRSWRLK